jgi:hypothetical protein
MASGDKSYFDNDAKSVNVTLTAAVLKDKVCVVSGWVGIAASDGAIGETIALQCDDRAYQFTVPAGLAVAKGAIVYLTIATVTGHYPDDAAYVLAPAAGTIPLFKAMEAKDVNNVVVGKLLPQMAYVS